jgi:hypothetical protein
VITLAMAVEIDARRTTVWEALTDPEQVTRWRPGLIASLDGAPGPPVVGRCQRWRLRLHELPVVMVERPLAVSPPAFLRSRQQLGLFRFDQALALRAAGSGGAHTRLAIRISTESQVPVVGGSLERAAVLRFASALAATTLEALRDWCEREALPVGASLPGIAGAVAANG